MHNMNFQTLLRQLTGELDYTQTAIAEHCGCGKATIHDLLSGKTEMPSFELGYKLTELHKAASAKARRQKAAKEKA